MLSSLVMPYANFDDVLALTSIYKNALVQDTDLSILEFIGEQLISGGLIEDEDEPKPLKTNNPHTTNTLEIQNGALHQHPVISALQHNICIATKIKQPTTCTAIPAQEFHGGVFHPPSLL